MSCGFGHYCPASVAAPVACPPFDTVDAATGLLSNGPAWDYDKAACFGHCFVRAAPRAGPAAADTLRD